MTVFVRIWKQNEQEKGQMFYTDWNGKEYVIQGQVDFNSWDETLENEKIARTLARSFGASVSVVCDWYKFKAPRTPRKNVTEMNIYIKLLVTVLIMMNGLKKLLK